MNRTVTVILEHLVHSHVTHIANLLNNTTLEKNLTRGVNVTAGGSKLCLKNIFQDCIHVTFKSRDFFVLNITCVIYKYAMKHARMLDHCIHMCFWNIPFQI